MRDNAEQLTDGLDEAQRESLGDVSRLADLLAAYSVPSEPGSHDDARLLAALAPYLPAPEQPGRSVIAWLTLAWSQARLLQAPFWWAGGMMLALGLILTLVNGDGLSALIFIFLTPVLAAAGVAYAFRPETETLWELERLTPTDPLALLYARITLVLIVDTLLSLTLLGTVWLQTPQLTLWRLLLTWLGPMLALVGLALYVTVRWGPTTGIVLPLGFWGALILVGWWQAVDHVADSQAVASWLLAQIGGSSTVLTLCLAAAGVGVLLLWQSGQWVKERAWI
jgi:hypothetical protein